MEMWGGGDVEINIAKGFCTVSVIRTAAEWNEG
jgi:hypothetical protein